MTASPDDRLTELMLACEEALAVGADDTFSHGADFPPELRERLDRNLDCLRLLHRVLPHRARVPQPLEEALLGRFRLLRRLGQGAFGVVWLAFDPRLSREVALKVPHAGALADEVLRRRFVREAEVAARLEHANVVAVYEAGEAGPVCYLVSAYCAGPNLAQWLKAREQPVPPRDAAVLVAALADGVAHAHQHGVVHRDLKPANVLLAPDGTPKITDFGLSKVLSESPAAEQTQSGAVVGTPAYMAPEQAAGKRRQVGTAADVWSLGVILYELLTGRPPFQADSTLETLLLVQTEEPVPPRRLRPAVPRDLERVCLKCLRKEPERRYAGAAQLAEELRRFGAGLPLRHTRPVGPTERAWRWCRRNPALAAVSGFAAVALLAVLGVSNAFAVYYQHAAAELSKSLAVAEAHRREAERAAADLAWDRGRGLCEQGDVSRGLLWFARALASAPREDDALQHALRLELAIWRQKIHPLRTVLPHPDRVLTVALSPDCRIALTGCADGRARLWDTASGQLLRVLAGHGRPVAAVTFSPDGRLILTGGEDGTARFWQVETGRQLGEAVTHPDRVAAVAFAPDGRRALTGCADGTARVWEVSAGRPLQRALQHPGPVGAVAWSPDGRALATGCHNPKAGNKGEMRLWDAETGKPLIEKPCLADLRFRSLAFSPDNRTVLSGDDNWDAVLWDAGTGRKIAHLGHEGRVGGVSFRPDGKAILTGADATQEAALWDITTLLNRDSAAAAAPRQPRAPGQGVRRRQPLGPALRHPGPVLAVAWGRDSRTLLTGGEDGTARLWDVAGGVPGWRTLAHPDPICAVAFSPDGLRMLTGCLDGTAHLWGPATGQLLGSFRAYPNDPEEVRRPKNDLGKSSASPPDYLHRVRAVAFLPDGHTLLTGCGDGTVRFWDAVTGKVIGTLPAQPREVSALAVSRDGRVLTGCHDGTVQLWDAATRQPVGPPLRHAMAVGAVAIDPAGRLLLTGCDDGFAQVWDAADGRPVGQPLRHQNRVNAVAFSPDGRRVVTASGDRTAQVWDTATGAWQVTCQHEAEVLAVAFSPDGRLLLTGDQGYRRWLWSAASGKLVGDLLSHDDLVNGVAFSPDGGTAVTVSWDRAGRLQPIPAPVAGGSEQVLLEAQLRTGARLDTAGGLHALDAAAWEQSGRRLRELAAGNR